MRPKGDSGTLLGCIRVLQLSTSGGRFLLLFHMLHQDVCGRRIEGPREEAEEHVRREQHDGEDDEYVDWLKVW